MLSVRAGGNDDDKRSRDNGGDGGGNNKRRRVVRFDQEPAEVFEIAPPSTTASQQQEDEVQVMDEEERTLDSEDEEAIREEVRESGFFVSTRSGSDDEDETEESEDITLGSEQEEQDIQKVRLKTRKASYPRDLKEYELIIPKGVPKVQNRFVYNPTMRRTIEEFRATDDIEQDEIVLYFGGELVFNGEQQQQRYPIKEVPGLYMDWSDASRSVSPWQLASFVPTTAELDKANVRIAALKPTKGTRSLTYKTAVYLVATLPIFKGEKLFLYKQ